METGSRIGELDAQPSQRVEALRQVFAHCQGLTVMVPPDINVALWEKFIFIVAVSGLGAATRQPMGIFRSLPETRHLLLAALEEVALVGRARGIALAKDAVNRILDDVVKACRPRECTVEGRFNARGGISISVAATYRADG